MELLTNIVLGGGGGDILNLENWYFTYFPKAFDVQGL